MIQTTSNVFEIQNSLNFSRTELSVRDMSSYMNHRYCRIVSRNSAEWIGVLWTLGQFTVMILLLKRIWRRNPLR